MVEYLPQSAILFGGYLYTEKGKHRFHDILQDIVVVFLSTYRAMEAAAGIMRTWPKDEYIALASLVFPNIKICIPAHGVLEHVLANVPVEYIKLGQYYVPYDDDELSKISMFTKFYNTFVAAYFVQFFDPWRYWIDVNISSNFRNWPKISNFARIVRNAASHGGTININDKNAPTITWYSLSYDHRSHGRSIFGADLSCADLLILMAEMDDELNKLGAPFSPS